MTYITQISRLRDCGVYQNFSWPRDLPEFGRYNLIYGWNATGKTTLSRLFRNLQLRQKNSMGEVVLKVDGNRVHGKDFQDCNCHIRVFNRDFIDENVFSTEGRDIPRILFLGKDRIEKQQKLESLKKCYEKTQSRETAARAAKQFADKNFDQFSVDRAKLIKETLRSDVNHRYNNYNKSNFQHCAKKMLTTGNGASCLLSDGGRETLLTKCRATPKPKAKEFYYVFPSFNETTDRLSKLLTRTIISETIKVLTADPSLAGWTRQGLRLHRDRKSEQCLFCEQPLREKRLAALEAHFNTQYEQFIQDIDREIKDMKEMSSKAKDAPMLVEAQFYDDLIPEFQEAKEALTSALGSVCDFFDAAVKILEDKKGRMFEHVPLDIETPSVDARAAKKLNAVIRQHNQRCVDFDAKVEDARGKLAADMIAEALDEFGRRSKKKHDAKTELERAEQEVQQLLSKITKLENEIVEHLQPVNELNRDLRNYLGHTELRLEIKDTGYAITRGGMPAKSLSEGETTAIALLYFLKSLKDNRFDFEKGVIVLDDPVSSLDANALFTAHAFMRQRCENTRQLFILTHNFSFFRQVRNWFAHMKGQRSNNNIDKRPARLYMLESVFEDGARSSTVRGLDPLLENYNSEYHYLFALVYRASKLAERRLERNYFLPNVARRVLEIFFDFRQPNILGSLRKKLQNVSFDEEKKFRILRFLHTHSHSLGMEDPGHDLTALTEAPSILKDLLELIESEDSKHYKAMEELLGVLPTDSGEVREGATTV